MNPRGSRSRPGFTLVELIVAGVITGLVAAAATLSVSHTLRARDSASARHAAFRRAAVAADRVSGDVRALLRDPDPLGVRFVLTDSGSADEAADQILLYARTLRRARAALPTEAESEGDAYEVQYRLG
ncbi:MAG TPA: prepilin-type N-terminal cleavage/methylation domain-containing protein, partial [Phycisphaerales bacterium]|nr:prepilin-type N-terminal cleavage/methylation domain-containing protein [Phycisphaerales bacterium]